MAIFKHPDGSHRRYPPQPEAVAQPDADDEYTNDAHWRNMDNARPGIQIHRDGKTMRNIAPTPRAWLNAPQDDRLVCAGAREASA